tara:strand:+ start:696 stop:3044 length:2349 start_codon:yes stop_codon:yes gene_type:complete
MAEEEILEEQAPEPVDVLVEQPTDEIVDEEFVKSEEDDFYNNIAEDLDDRTLSAISNDLISEYKKDKESRSDWEKSYTSGLDLLGFKYMAEGQPFRGASGVTHPLLSEAVTQFQAQAYKELLPSDGPVRTHVVGDMSKEKEEQAERVKEFMNYMIMEKMEEYTPEFDQLLFYLPLAGSAFKKIYYDEIRQRAVSKFVPAEDLVVPYYATDLQDCERVTHVIKMMENDILKKQKSGFYRDVDLLPTQEEDDIQNKYDEIEGTTDQGPRDYQYNILEMHVDCNIDDYTDPNSEKNVKVPYIITIDEGSGKILSIYRNFSPDDETFKRNEYFVHYKFLPGLGFYGFGLIHMIGGLSKTATAALRQLLDAGTLSNLPAGFKSRGIRIRDDDQPFQPGEFRDVDAPGGNIKDQFQILPFKEPSNVLFQLLGFVVQAGQRFAAIADMSVGNDTQNRAVGTTIALLERGSRVMSAIHKRCYYAMRQEFRLLARVFGTYLPPIYPYSVYGGNRLIKAPDFSEDVDVIPVADPNIFSMAQRVTLAQTQLQIAQSAPQLHNVREAFRRVYESLGTKQVDNLLKPEKPPIPKDPAIENAEALRTEVPQAYPEQNHDAHILSHGSFIKTRMVQINPVVYALLQAHISEHISMKARAQVVVMITTQRPELQELKDKDPQAFQIEFDSMVALRIMELTAELQQAEQMTEKGDPLVELKQRELDLRAMDMQRKSGEFRTEEQRKGNEFEQRIDLDKMKREDAEDASEERIRVADDKLRLQAEKMQIDMQKNNNKERN